MDTYLSRADTLKEQFKILKVPLRDADLIHRVYQGILNIAPSWGHIQLFLTQFLGVNEEVWTWAAAKTFFSMCDEQRRNSCLKDPALPPLGVREDAGTSGKKNHSHAHEAECSATQGTLSPSFPERGQTPDPLSPSQSASRR
jgi:hypothetical protein